MTPQEVLALWQELHPEHELSPRQRVRFLARAEIADLCRYPKAAVTEAFRASPKLSETRSILIEAHGVPPRRQVPTEPDPTPAKPTAKKTLILGRDKPSEKIVPAGPAPTPVKRASKTTSRIKTSSLGGNKAKRPKRKRTGRAIENTEPYRSASGSGMLRNWGNRKAQPPMVSDERAKCKACDRPAMNCTC